MNERQSTPDILGNMLTGPSTGAEPKTEHIKLTAIKVNGGTQMRAGLNTETVAEYAESMKERGWGDFPAITVYYDGQTYWLADGFHRLAAFRMIGVAISDALIPAIVKAGDQRAAILHAAGANAQHGLRRTNADKRRAVEVLLGDAEWSQWSNVEIGRRCAVAESSVRNIRADMESTSQIAKSTIRTGADGRTYNTTNIGTNRPPQPANRPTPQPEEPVFAAVMDLQGAVNRVWNALNPNNDPAIDKELGQVGRQAIVEKGGDFWERCKEDIEHGFRAWRHQDMRQAMANVIKRKESGFVWSPTNTQVARPLQEPFVPTPNKPEPGVWIPPTLAEFNARPRVTGALDLQANIDMCWDLQYGKVADPATLYANIKQARYEAEHQGHFFNFCHDSADDELRPFTDNTLTFAIQIYCDRLAAVLLASNPELFPAMPVTNYEDEEEEEEEDETVSPEIEAIEAGTMSNLLRRQQQLEDLRDQLIEALAAIREAGELTGKHTVTLGADRELRRVIELLDNELDAILKGATHEYA